MIGDFDYSLTVRPIKLLVEFCHFQPAKKTCPYILEDVLYNVPILLGIKIVLTC